MVTIIVTDAYVYVIQQHSVRTHAVMVHLNLTADYRHQDPEKLADVFKLVSYLLTQGYEYN